MSGSQCYIHSYIPVLLLETRSGNISLVKSQVVRDWEAATDTLSSSMSPWMFLPPLNILLSPGTVHTLNSEYGFHPPLLSLAQPEAIVT